MVRGRQVEIRAVPEALACGACRVESRARRSGGMADAADSKSVGRKAVWVRLPPPAPKVLIANTPIGPGGTGFSLCAFDFCTRNTKSSQTL